MSVRSQPSYVKKIIFPVEILPIVPLGAALVQTMISLLLLALVLAWTGYLSVRVLLYPLMLVPILLLGLGVSWFVSSWGVFIKDVNQIVPVLVQMLFFLSPVLYSASMVPEVLRPVIVFNPLGPVIESCRALITGNSIDWAAWAMALGVGSVTAWLGYAMFQHQRDEFADVL
jgi:lipopolysaccharide transport system permease protein